jgi:hypothetical protein
MSWQTGRPIYDRLPGQNEAYRKESPTDEDPAIADWLTAPWDELLTGLRSAIDNIPQDMLDPATAKPENLDWLAQLCGFTGEYWDTSWPVAVKRELIANSLNFVWENKGTRALLEWLIDLFGLEASVYQVGAFLAGISLVGDPIGDADSIFEYYLVVSLDYLRTSTQWKLLERLNRLYGPVYADSRVCYDGFYAGFSVVGDPIF